MQHEEITVKVAKGTKVRVQEVDTLSDPDPRIKADRDIHIELPSRLKLAVKRTNGANEKGLTANVITMCG